MKDINPVICTRSQNGKKEINTNTFESKNLPLKDSNQKIKSMLESTNMGIYGRKSDC